MVVSCCVVGCTKRFKKGDGIKFHIFPQTKPRRTMWINAVKRIDVNTGKNGFHLSVCSQHFISGKKTDDPNHPDYVPSVNLKYETTDVLSGPSAAVDRYDRLQRGQQERKGQRQDIGPPTPGEVEEPNVCCSTEINLGASRSEEIQRLKSEMAAMGTEMYNWLMLDFQAQMMLV